MNKNYIVFCFALLLAISLVSAGLESLGTFKQNEVVRVTQVCSTASYINITSISYPNSSVAVASAGMTAVGNGEFYFDFENTTQLGRYDIRQVSDGCEKTFAYWFDVTPNGLSQTTAQGLGSMGFLFLMLILTGLFGWLGFKFSESDKLWIMGIFFMFLSTLFIVYDVWLGYEFHRNFTGLTDSSMPEIIFYIFLLLLVLGILVSLALLFTKWKELGRYIKRELKRKDDEEFDKDFE